MSKVTDWKELNDIKTEIHVGDTIVYNNMDLRIISKVLTKQEYNLTLQHKDIEFKINPNNFKFFYSETTGKLKIEK